MGHLHSSSAGPDQCPFLPVRRAPRLGRGASCSALGGHWHVDGSLVKTMSDASDWRCWRLVRHIPVEGIVLGFLHAHAAGSLIPLQPAVGGRLHLFRLPVLYHRAITMFVGATTITTDALPLLVWRMLCRPCYSYSDGCFAIMVATCWSPSTDALPSWCCSGGCLATLMLF